MTYKMLDCFCGMGGVSDGFAKEGFDVTGIDIENAPEKLGYKHKFIQADFKTLNGTDFRQYDVIWGSPPCRDFTILGLSVGYRWKRKPDPAFGLQMVNAYLNFIQSAKPKFWIMENSHRLELYLALKPRASKTVIGETMKRSFWGNFPLFLQVQDMSKKKIMGKSKNGKMSHLRINGKIPLNESWVRAKIPLGCSLAFARACKEALDSQSMPFILSDVKK
jgi:DNA (cytosine-5)-methyltransferase 1